MLTVLLPLCYRSFAVPQSAHVRVVESQSQATPLPVRRLVMQKRGRSQVVRFGTYCYPEVVTHIAWPVESGTVHGCHACRKATRETIWILVYVCISKHIIVYIQKSGTATFACHRDPIHSSIHICKLRTTSCVQHTWMHENAWRLKHRVSHDFESKK